MAEGGDNRTLWVAVAGIAATALVGLAGTTAAWLSARDDRATQRQVARADRAHQLALAHAQRTYDRPVAVYLDAIDFLEGQRRSLARYEEPSVHKKRRIAFHYEPPSRLFSRLQAFGSPRVVKALQRAQSEIQLLPIEVEVHSGGHASHAGTAHWGASRCQSRSPRRRKSHRLHPRDAALERETSTGRAAARRRHSGNRTCVPP